MNSQKMNQSLGEDEGTLNRNCNKKSDSSFSSRILVSVWPADLVPVHQRNFNKEEFSSHVVPRILNDPEPKVKLKKSKMG